MKKKYLVKSNWFMGGTERIHTEVELTDEEFEEYSKAGIVLEPAEAANEHTEA